MKLNRLKFGLAVSMLLCVASDAQAPVLPVQWLGAVAQKTPVTSGMRIVIELSAEVQQGWHIYGLTQSTDGPTPLRVALETNDVVQIAGAPSSTAPVKKHDPAFDLDTEVYERSFEVYLPVQINQHASSGKSVAPVSVRDQACDGRICLPPRAVHIAVPIEISSNN